MKHTPGPWHVAEYRYGQTVRYEIATHVQTKGNRLSYCCLAVPTNTINAEANARLIAKAPEMLEEHKAWAHEFGAALLLYLQGDHGAIDNLAYDLIIDFDRNGEPTIRSKVLAQIEEEAEEVSCQK